MQIFVVSAVRTAIGSFGGTLRDHEPGELAARVATEALRRGGLPAAAIGHVVFGQVIPTAPKDAYLARIATLGAGLSCDVPALTVNRLCGSGLQAILSAAQAMALGDCEAALAGGAEVMSRAPFLAPAVRWGNRLGDAKLVDGLNGALTDPFENVLMGVTAENVAARAQITVRYRMHWRCKAIGAPPMRSPAVTSRIRSCRFRSGPGRPPLTSRSMSTSARVSPPRISARCGRYSAPRAAPSPRATPPASTTGPLPCCSRARPRSAGTP